MPSWKRAEGRPFVAYSSRARCGTRAIRLAAEILPAVTSAGCLSKPFLTSVSLAMSAITSEDSILEIINRHFPSEHPRLLLGRGDDCCVLATGEALAISTDLFMEDVHFRRSYFTPGDIGWKALAVNVSDLAAGGAYPAGFSLGLALPRDTSAELVDGLFAGMAELAGPLQLPLTGGDLSLADRLHLCVVTPQAQPACAVRTPAPAIWCFSAAGSVLPEWDSAYLRHRAGRPWRRTRKPVQHT